MTSSERAEEVAPRGSLALLLDPVFGRFVAARVLATAAVWIHNIVAAVVVYELSESALMVGLVSVAQFGPQLILAPMSGAMADRNDRRLQLVLGRSLVALGSGTLAAWILIAGVDGLPGPWPVLAAAVVVGLGFVFASPAQDSLLPALVRPGELAPAVALNAIPPTLARAVGPAAGAVVATAFGPGVAFALASSANVLFVLIVMSLKVRTRPEPTRDSDQRVRAGFRYLRHDRGVLLLLGGISAVGVAADPVITLTPPLAEEFGRGATLVGAFASAFGVGALVIFSVLGILRRRFGLPRLGTAGLLFMAVGLLSVGIVRVLPIVVAAFVTAGAGMTMASTSFTTQLQQRVPDEFRGRVMAFWAVAFLGTRPLAAAMNGAVADATALPIAFAVVACVVLGLAWVSKPEAVAARPIP